MQVSCFAVLFQFIVIKVVTAYSISPIRFPASQLNPVPAENVNQQLLKSLLSSSYNEAQFPERLEILTAALKQMPPKRNNIGLADLLKQSALESLTTAANVCKRTGALPAELPGQIGMRRQIELPVAEFTRQIGVRRQIELPVAELTGQVGMRRQIELPLADLTRLFGVQGQIELPMTRMPGQVGLPGQMRLPEKNRLVLPANVPVKEVFGNIPADYAPTRRIRIQYY